MTQPPSEELVPILRLVGGAGEGDGDGEGLGDGVGDTWTAGEAPAGFPADALVAGAASGARAGVEIDGIEPQPAIRKMETSSHRSDFCTPGPRTLSDGAASELGPLKRHLRG